MNRKEIEKNKEIYLESRKKEITDDFIPNKMTLPERMR